MKKMKGTIGPDGSLKKGRLLLYNLFMVYNNRVSFVCDRGLFELLRTPSLHNPLGLCRRNRLFYAGLSFIRGSAAGIKYSHFGPSK